jgi:hypothetical protein
MWFAIGLIILGVLALYTVAVITCIMAFMFSPWLGIVVVILWLFVLGHFQIRVTK